MNRDHRKFSIKKHPLNSQENHWHEYHLYKILHDLPYVKGLKIRVRATDTPGHTNEKEIVIENNFTGDVHFEPRPSGRNIRKKSELRQRKQEK